MLGALSRDEQQQLHTLLGKLKSGLHSPPAAANTAAPSPARSAARHVGRPAGARPRRKETP
jgi:hypothetical protein